MEYTKEELMIIQLNKKIELLEQDLLDSMLNSVEDNSSENNESFEITKHSINEYDIKKIISQMSLSSIIKIKYFK